MLVRVLTGAVTMENSTEILKKFKIELLYDPAITILAIYLKKTKNTNSKRYMHPPVHCSIRYNSLDVEATSAAVQ